MAFSYSDKNFTVIGNLCFVHIPMDGTKDSYDIPPAIADRTINNVSIFLYPYRPKGGVNSVGFAVVTSGEIICSEAGSGYLSFCFPIDSNK